MLKGILPTLIIVLFSYFVLILPENSFSQTLPSENSIIISIPKYNKTNDHLDITYSNTEGPRQILRIFPNEVNFDLKPNYDNDGNLFSIDIDKKIGFDDIYNKIKLFGNPHDTVFIYPSFTQAAYDTNGFYDYYKMRCDYKCLTVQIPDKIFGGPSSSSFGAAVLHLLNFSYVKDEDVDKDPNILKQYKRVIVLHNEYVTKREFDAIINHPNVVFFYPNALYAQVTTDYTNNTITLVRGHGYPDKSISNGFDWKYDNSKYEYDKECENWQFYAKGNYTMLNCYPEYMILYDMKMIEALQSIDPTDLRNNLSDWLMNNDQNETGELLGSFDIKGNHIPTWVERPALMLLNGQISSDEFGNMLNYVEKTVHQLDN